LSSPTNVTSTTAWVVEPTLVDPTRRFGGLADHLSRSTSRPRARIASSFNASRCCSHAVLWNATLSVSTIKPHSGQ
jgi:hypothetical protein